jgi:Alkylmercury lyase
VTATNTLHSLDPAGRRWENRGVEERDVELRNFTYSSFVEAGRAPTADEVGRAAGLTISEVHAGWRRLHEAHALVLNPATMEIRMANPFSAVPSAYRVRADRRWWYANCAWDALGICGALHVDGRIETSCPDCGEPITLEVRDERPDDESLLFDCLVPAAHWWDDIFFT